MKKVKKILFVFFTVIFFLLVSNSVQASTKSRYGAYHKTETKWRIKKEKSKRQKRHVIAKAQKKAYAGRDCQRKTVKRTPNRLW